MPVRREPFGQGSRGLPILNVQHLYLRSLIHPMIQALCICDAQWGPRTLLSSLYLVYSILDVVNTNRTIQT